MKTNITISIDLENIIEMRKRKVNISQIINDFLKNYIQIPEIETKEDINEQINVIKTKLIELEREKIKREPKPTVVLYG